MHTSIYKCIQTFTNICTNLYKSIGVEQSWVGCGCMTRRGRLWLQAAAWPPLPDLIVLHTSSTACKDTNVLEDSSALGICALWRCRRKIQKFAVHAVLLSRVSIGKQGVPPGGCSPSRDTLSLQGQEYSGEGENESSAIKAQKLPTWKCPPHRILNLRNYPIIHQ